GYKGRALAWPRREVCAAQTIIGEASPPSRPRGVEFGRDGGPFGRDVGLLSTVFVAYVAATRVGMPVPTFLTRISPGAPRIPIAGVVRWTASAPVWSFLQRGGRRQTPGVRRLSHVSPV